MQIQSKRCNGMVTVNHFALFTDKNRTIGITVVRNTDMRLMFDHGFLETLRIDGATFGINVRSIRLITDHPDRGAELAQDLRRDLIGCSIRTIDDDTQSLEIELPWQRPLHELDIPAFRIINTERFSDLVRRGAQMFDLI